MKTNRLVLAFALLLVGAGAAHAGKTDWIGPATYENNGLTITVDKLFHDGKKLHFELQFVNKTGKEMVVDRDQLQVKLPDGSIHMREKPSAMWGGNMISAIHKIPGGTSHEVHVEFLIPKESTGATLVLKGVVEDGKDYPVADFVVAPKK